MLDVDTLPLFLYKTKEFLADWGKGIWADLLYSPNKKYWYMGMVFKADPWFLRTYDSNVSTRYKTVREPIQPSSKEKDRISQNSHESRSHKSISKSQYPCKEKISFCVSSSAAALPSANFLKHKIKFYITTSKWTQENPNIIINREKQAKTCKKN